MSFSTSTIWEITSAETSPLQRTHPQIPTSNSYKLTSRGYTNSSGVWRPDVLKFAYTYSILGTLILDINRCFLAFLPPVCLFVSASMQFMLLKTILQPRRIYDIIFIIPACFFLSSFTTCRNALYT